MVVQRPVGGAVVILAIVVVRRAIAFLCMECSSEEEVAVKQRSEKRIEIV